jgi:hypothetical protein
VFQFLLLCSAGERRDAARLERPDWTETAAWRRGQWGQLTFVLLGVGLCGAGAVLCFLGCTSVFVEEDLEFMRTTAARLALAHDRLVPLVAHDRASLGGMLLSNGVALLTVLRALGLPGRRSLAVVGLALGREPSVHRCGGRTSRGRLHERLPSRARLRGLGVLVAGAGAEPWPCLGAASGVALAPHRLFRW